MLLVQQYQMRVIGPSEVVEYSRIVMESYPPQAPHLEPFIGFKALCRDGNAFTMNPADRLRQIDANLGFLRGTGCIIRETKSSMPDGFWVITLPVPRSQVSQQLSNFMTVLRIFEQNFGIVCQGLFEINVSGRCNITDTERCLSGLMIPPRYTDALVSPENTPYRFGNVVRINDEFMCLRTRWSFKATQSMDHCEDLIVLSQLISSMYH